MKCPFCQVEDTKVVDSRGARDGLAIKRRRECLQCGERFSTFEQIAAPSTVLKRSGKRTVYERRKVAASIERACSKGSLTEEALEEMLARIEAELSKVRRGDVECRTIGELVMRELAKFDPMAYLRFASVYQDFKNVKDMEDAIRPMLADADVGSTVSRV